MSSSSTTGTNTAPSFSVGDGRFVWSLGSSNEIVYAARVDSAGRILVAGSQGSLAMLSRFNGNGSLDTTFGNGGILTSSNAAAYNDVLIQSDGSITAVGGSTAFVMDNFGVDGAFSTTRSLDVSTGNDSIAAIVRQGSNFIVAGTASSSTGSDFAVARYTASGLDTTFGASGRRTVDVSGADIAHAATVQSDGKIIVVGSLLATGTTTTDIAIARFTSNGLIDSSTNSPGASFGTSGKASLTFGTGHDVARSVAVQSDGKILVGGFAQIVGSNYDFVVARYTSAGALDATFGVAGKATIAIGTGDDQSYAMALQSDGKILLGGYSVNSAGNRDFAVVRLTSGGALDSTFGSGGRVTTGIMSGSHDTISHLGIQSDGKIVASGYASSGSQNDITLVRYNTDGSVDTTFNPVNTLNASPTFTEGSNAVVLDSDVMIYDAELATTGTYAGATVRLQRTGGANVDDVFSSASGGGVSALTEGANLSVGSTVVGTVTQNSAGTLLITFSTLASQSAVNSVLQSLSYSNASRNPPATVTIDWLFSDGNTGLQGTGSAAEVSGSTTVNVTAVNDAPTLVAIDPVTFIDTSADDSFSNVTGTLAGADVDSSSLTYGITGGTDTGSSVVRQVSYGTLTVNKTTGAYTYAPDDAAIEALLANAAESFTVTVSDGSLSASRTLQVNLAASADTPALANIAAVQYTDTQVDDSFATTTGQITLSSGSSSGLTFGVSGGSVNGDSATLGSAYGVISVNRTTGAFAFTPDSAAINSLKAADTAQFTLTASNGRDVQSTVFTLQFSGVNDVPVFASSPSVSYTDTAVDDVFQVATGTLPRTDREGDTLTYGISGGSDAGTTVSASGTYGTLTITKATGMYVFVPDQVAVENTTGAVSETFTLTLDDGTLQGSDTFTVNIAGTNEAPSFALGSGIASVSFGSGNDSANAMALMSDGRFYLAGQTTVSSNTDIALSRHNLDGSRSTSFSGDGLLTDNNGTGQDIARAIAVQTDGKVLVAGSSTVSSTLDFSVLRYNTDGTLDTAFSADGKQTTAFGVPGSDEAYAVLTQTDGKILVAGHTFNGSNNDFAVVRYNGDGSLDTTGFNASASTTNRGRFSFDFTSSGDIVYAMALQTDGKILLAGQSINGTNSDFAVARLTAAGALDNTFSGDARQTTAVGSGEDVARSMVLLSDGKILLGGWSSNGSNNDFALVRYSSDGNLDTTFGSSGRVVTTVGTGRDQAYAMTVQSDGKIVLAGSAVNNGNDDFAVVRYNANGSLDTTFGTGGRVITAISSGADVAYSVAIEADGKILVSGSTTVGGSLDFVAVRYNSNGSLDTTFNPVDTLGNTIAYTEQAQALVIDASVGIHDPEAATAGQFDAATVSLSRRGGASADDVFSAIGNGTLSALTESDALVLGGVTVGSVSRNSTGVLELVFNAQATPERVTSVLQQIAYSNTSDNPPATVTIDWTFSDGNRGGDAAGARQATGSTTIAVTAIDDAPVLQSVSSLQLADTSADDTFASQSGQLQATDVDSSAFTYGVVDGSDNGTTVVRTGSYGTLTVIKATGAYTFAPNDAAVEALVANASDTFTLSVSDASSTVTTQLTVNVTGAADAAVLTTPLAIALTDTSADNTFSVVNRSLQASSGMTNNFGIANGTDNGTTVTRVGTYGTLAITKVTGAYTYTPNDSAIESLKQNASESFSVTAGNPRDASTSSTTLTVNVTGANDTPVISTPATISFTDTAGNDTFTTRSASLSASDRDSDTLTYGLSNGTDNGTTVSLAGSYGTLTLTKATGAYTFVPSDAALEALTANASESFTVTVSDGTATVNTQLTVNVTGAADAATLSTPAALSITDTAADDNLSTALTGTVQASGGTANNFGIANGTDNGTTVTRVGTYGTLVITKATGAYTYTPSDSAVEALKQNVSESFSITAGNPRDASTSSTILTVNVTGANDTPVISTPAAISYTDTAADDTFATRNASLSASDRDNDTLTYGLSNGMDNGTTVSRTGSYGTLVITKATGAYTFTPNDAALEALTANASESFTVTVSDGTATANAQLTVNVTGANDAPVISSPATISYTDTAGDDAFTTRSASLSVSDRDGDTLTYGLSNGTDNGTTVSRIGSYGTLTVTKATGAYTFTPNDAALEALAANASESFTLTASDGSATALAQLVVNVSGANEAPIIAATSPLTYTDTANDDTFTTLGATLSVFDRESDSLVFGLSNGTDNGTSVSRVGNYGTLTINKSTGSYTYVPNDGAIEARSANATDVFNLTASDATSTAVTTLTVNVLAANDAASSANFQLDVNAQQQIALSATAFAFVDRDSGDNLSAIQITDLPGRGQLMLGSSSVGAGTTVSKSALEAGLLKYAAPAVSGSPQSDFLKFRVLDSAGLASADTYSVDFRLLSGTPNASPTGTLSIRGLLTVGQTLTLSSTLADGNGLGQITYTWRADGVAIANSNASSFTLTSAEAGRRISVTAAYVDGDGYGESITSTQTALVGLRLEGGSGNDSLTGSAANDSLIGLAGNDTLNGGLGLDTMIGGLGNDVYLVNAAADVVIENAGEGTDTIQSSVTYTLLANFETLTLIGSGAINGVGNAFANFISGNSAANSLSGGDGNDTLSGGSGTDTLVGGLGNDTYLIVDSQDIVTELEAQGTDVVQASASHTLQAHVENIILTGSAAINGFGNDLDNQLTGNTAANRLEGRGGNDVLSGASGVDTLVGGLGDDTYVISDLLDVLLENAGEGNDTIRSSVSCTALANIENIVLTGTVAINATGNTLNNALTGNSAANRLEGSSGNDTLAGGSGLDTLIGGTGDDTYVLTDTVDLLQENAGEGIDTVVTGLSVTLIANIENAMLTGALATSATGNGGNNVLTGNQAANKLFGNEGNDTLDGGGGVDTLIGGVGDDSYIVNDAAVMVSEKAGEGTDTVFSAVSYTLGTGLEHLTLTGTAVVNGVGNSLNNQMNGNTGNNRLDGGAGNDTLSGGAGADTLIGGIGNDVFVMDASTIGPQMDVISDMNTIDRIDLRLIDAIASTSADDAFVFLGTTAFAAGQAGRVRYQSTQFENQPALLVQGDVNGDAQADFSVIVVGVTQLAATQFLL